MGTYRSLALVDEDQAAVERQIEEFQAHDFQTPQAGRIDRFQDGAVPESDWVIDFAQRHDSLDLFNGEDGLGQSAAQPGQVDLRRRVMQDVVLPGHPSEPHAQGHKPRVLAAEGQRLPVLLAVEEQVPLIAFEHGPGDLDGFAQPVFVGPLDEKADVNETVLHRELGVAAHTQRVQMLVHEQFHRRLRRGLGLAGFGYAGHALPPVLPLGFCAATTTTGVCGMLLASAPLYAFFALLSEKPASTRVIAGDFAS